MPDTLVSGFTRNFLGKAPNWYKQVILLFLIANPIVMFVFGPVTAGWLLIAEFIFTLAMALKCYLGVSTSVVLQSVMFSWDLGVGRSVLKSMDNWILELWIETPVPNYFC